MNPNTPAQRLVRNYIAACDETADALPPISEDSKKALVSHAMAQRRRNLAKAALPAQPAEAAPKVAAPGTLRNLVRQLLATVELGQAVALKAAARAARRWLPVLPSASLYAIPIGVASGAATFFLLTFGIGNKKGEPERLHYVQPAGTDPKVVFVVLNKDDSLLPGVFPARSLLPTHSSVSPPPGLTLLDLRSHSSLGFSFPEADRKPGEWFSTGTVLASLSGEEAFSSHAFSVAYPVKNTTAAWINPSLFGLPASRALKIWNW